MIHAARLIVITAVSLMIAFGLSLLPPGKGFTQSGSNIPAFGSDAPQELQEQNLVDFMETIPLTLSVGSVNWDGSTLRVDLAYHGDDVSPEVIYRDMYETVYHSLVDTTNVQQIMMRVFAAPSGDSPESLLIAVDAKRSEITSLPPSPLQAEKVLNEHFRVIKTYRFRELFQPDA